jgi:anti-sigma B factor antagonist
VTWGVARPGATSASLVTGEIDVRTAPDLRARLHHAVDGCPGTVVTLDLSGLEFMDSTGLGVLIDAQKRARRRDGDVVLIAVPARIAKLFIITGLHKVFDMTESG